MMRRGSLLDTCESRIVQYAVYVRHVRNKITNRMISLPVEIVRLDLINSDQSRSDGDGGI